jgi:hypothetical protein
MNPSLPLCLATAIECVSSVTKVTDQCAPDRRAAQARVEVAQHLLHFVMRLPFAAAQRADRGFRGAVRTTPAAGTHEIAQCRSIHEAPGRH